MLELIFIKHLPVDITMVKGISTDTYYCQEDECIPDCTAEIKY
jgi:hypothetical protein